MRLGEHVDRLHMKLTTKTKPKTTTATVTELMRRAMDTDDASNTPVVTVRSSSGNSADDPNSFHRAMRPILTIAQVFGHIPVDGVAGSNADTLSFRWCSVKVIYTFYCLVTVVFMICIHTSDLFIHQGSATFSRSSSILFCLVAILNMSCCLLLAKKWPSLQRTIQNLELAMKINYGYPKNLSRNLRIITYAILIVSLVEHVVSRVKEITLAMKCADSTIEWLRVYFSQTYTIIFTYLVDFSFIISLLLEHSRYVQVFAWNFMDVIVIVFSIMLTARLRQVSVRLNAVKNMTISERFWRQVREDYNELSQLVKLVDQHINKITLLTFGNNLYFICLQLLLSMQKEMSVTQSIYFYTSFLHLVLRSTAMCLIAASIYDESLEPKSVLFSVPSESYTKEVQRFIMQVATDTVALTGMKFFSITKMLLLTVVGTIVTYEIVLIQFEDSEETNAQRVVNPYCPNKTSS